MSYDGVQNGKGEGTHIILMNLDGHDSDRVKQTAEQSSRIMSTMGNRSLHEVLRATYSASMMERVISIWSLDFHRMGQLKTVMRKPVWLQVQ